MKSNVRMAREKGGMREYHQTYKAGTKKSVDFCRLFFYMHTIWVKRGGEEEGKNISMENIKKPKFFI